jgi:hypothetical protein
VVLIDSRTGVTEMSGICTHVLPDSVVSFIAPNRQNIDGVLGVARSLADADRQIRQVFVPSRVDITGGPDLDTFRIEFEREFSPFYPKHLRWNRSFFHDLSVPYITSCAFEETLALESAERLEDRAWLG